MRNLHQNCSPKSLQAQKSQHSSIILTRKVIRSLGKSYDFLRLSQIFQWVNQLYFFFENTDIINTMSWCPSKFQNMFSCTQFVWNICHFKSFKFNTTLQTGLIILKNKNSTFLFDFYYISWRLQKFSPESCILNTSVFQKYWNIDVGKMRP